MFDPEAIEAALFKVLQTATSTLNFKQVSRHAKIWGNTTPDSQPALFLIPLGGHVEQNQAFGAPRYILHYLTLVYARADGSPTALPPQTVLNNAWKAIQIALLGPTPGQKQTLGGLVQNAWIEGEVTMQASILDQQGALEIPVHAITGI